MKDLGGDGKSAASGSNNRRARYHITVIYETFVIVVVKEFYT